MNNPKRKTYIASGAVLMAFFTVSLVSYLILQSVFNYPDILRQPTEEVLSLLQENRAAIIPAYYGYTLTGVLFIAFSVLLYYSFDIRNSALLGLATVFGVINGLFQMIGFVRWPFLKPYLAEVFTDPTSKEATREAVVVVYESFNRYAGMGAGENLGHVMWGLWTIGFSLTILKTELFDKRLGWVGIVIGISYLVYSLEQLGISSLAFLVVPTYAAFGVWQCILALSLFRTDPNTGRGPKIGWLTLLFSILLFITITVPAYT